MSDAQPKPGVLFVCYANVCRSPLAAGLLRALAEQRGVGSRLRIDSAGTSAIEGSPPHPLSCAVAKQHGFELSGYARQLIRDDLTRFDHVLVMDRRNLATIERLAGPQANLRLLRALTKPRARGPELDIPDPIGSGAPAYAKVYELLREGCEALLDELQAQL